jgi:hypothetical protein
VISYCVSSFKLLHSIPDACNQGLKFLFGQFEQEPQVVVGLGENVDNSEQFLFGHDMPLYPKPLCLSMHFKGMEGGDYATCSRGFSRFRFPWHKADLSKVLEVDDIFRFRVEISRITRVKRMAFSPWRLQARRTGYLKLSLKYITAEGILEAN